MPQTIRLMLEVVEKSAAGVGTASKVHAASSRVPAADPADHITINFRGAHDRSL